MKIIIEVKDTAALNRIDELDKALGNQYFDGELGQFSDVIKSISKEW